MTYKAFEENEVSINSVGGTEITKRSVAEGVDKDIADNFQIIAARVRELNNEKIRVLWLHDLAEDGEVALLKNESDRAKFHKFVYSSSWQRQQYVTKLGMPQTIDSVVIETAVDPIPVHTKDNTGEVRLIYFSTPNRGLEILVPVFEKLAEKYPNIVLDVFSSFKIYGWENMDKQYEPLFQKCIDHPQINYHGFQSQEVVREALQKAHIFAYPNIWEETSCRCLIESMSAGLLCIHPNFGALADTSGGLTSMYSFDENMNVHANVFLANLAKAIDRVHEPAVQKYLAFVKVYADCRFALPKIQKIWEGFLKATLDQYPTVETRMPRKSEEVFRYRTF